MEKRHVNPWEWQHPFGYSQAWRVDGPRSIIYLAGQVAITPDGTALSDADFDTQARQVFENIGAVLAEAGAGFERHRQGHGLPDRHLPPAALPRDQGRVRHGPPARLDGARDQGPRGAGPPDRGRGDRRPLIVGWVHAPVRDRHMCRSRSLETVRYLLGRRCGLRGFLGRHMHRPRMAACGHPLRQGPHRDVQGLAPCLEPELLLRDPHRLGAGRGLDRAPPDRVGVGGSGRTVAERHLVGRNDASLTPARPERHAGQSRWCPPASSRRARKRRVEGSDGSLKIRSGGPDSTIRPASR